MHRTSGVCAGGLARVDARAFAKAYTFPRWVRQLPRERWRARVRVSSDALRHRWREMLEGSANYAFASGSFTSKRVPPAGRSLTRMEPPIFSMRFLVT